MISEEARARFAEGFRKMRADRARQILTIGEWDMKTDLEKVEEALLPKIAGSIEKFLIEVGQSEAAEYVREHYTHDKITCEAVLFKDSTSPIGYGAQVIFKKGGNVLRLVSNEGLKQPAGGDFGTVAISRVGVKVAAEFTYSVEVPKDGIE